MEGGRGEREERGWKVRMGSLEGKKRGLVVKKVDCLFFFYSKMFHHGLFVFMFRN